MILREERIGNQRLLLGDCLQVMPLLGRFDAVVTDPPYGIGFGTFNRTNKDAQGNRYKANAYKHGDWDDGFDFRPAYSELKAMGVPLVVWGGNYFPCVWQDGGKGIAFWHKAQPVKNFSKGELAWTNIDMPAQFLHYPYFGGIEGNTAAGRKDHPTQKPVAVMEWCLGFLPKAQTILDPFMGSGTTLVACQSMGRHGTGIELDPDYFAIACKRVDEAARQPDLLIPETRPQPTQEAMDL